MENLTSKVEIITPQLAREYLTRNKVNRRLTKNHVDFLAKEIINNEWKLNGEAICFQDNYLVNGQHRLNAIIKANKPIKTLVVRGCDKDSFLTYDSGRNRSVSDVFSIKDIPNYALMSSIVQKYFAFSYGWSVIAATRNKYGGSHLSGNGKKKTKYELLREYEDNAALYQRIGRFAAACTDKIRLFSKTEIGGLCVYLIKDKYHSEDFVCAFFRMLYYNEYVGNNTINLLREKIIQDAMSNKAFTGQYKQALLVKTWNAYVLNKEYRVLNYNEAKEGKLAFL